MLRLNADGSKPALTPIEYYPIDLETGRPYAGDEPDGRPGVGFVLQYLAPDVVQQLRKSHTKPTLDELTGAIREVFDETGHSDAFMQLAIVDWWGFDGADGVPLPCTDATKIIVPDMLMRGEIRWRSTRWMTPALEVAAKRESFRKSPGVRDLVGGLEQDGSVLPAGDAGRDQD